MAARRDGDGRVPPTIQALLAARLDQLEPAERRVLERGAVEGEIFHRGAVQALAPEEPAVTPRLAALVRKELIRPDRSQLPGDDAFRFRHLLVRDAAYDGAAEGGSRRAARALRGLAGGAGADLVELDELLGYHLEQAARYRGARVSRIGRLPNAQANSWLPLVPRARREVTARQRLRCSSVRSMLTRPGRSTSTSRSTWPMPKRALAMVGRWPPPPPNGRESWRTVWARRLHALSRRRAR